MILPDYKGLRFSYWNADRWAFHLTMGGWGHNILDTEQERKEYWAERKPNEDPPNPFMKPKYKERLSENAKRTLFADVLYGGYLEDRSFLWRGSYMEPSKFLHLGIDFTGEAETGVCIDEPAELVQVYCDTPEESGWGTRLMFRLLNYPEYHLVYGHLRPPAVPYFHNVGDRYSAGQLIGYLGTSEQNGGWSPHLHVQAIFGDVQEFLDDPASLDGYGEKDHLEALARRFPDPLRFISIR